jgi:hypothetical protein
MDKKQAEQIIKNFELVKAFANGATIQYTERYVEPKCWVDTGCPIWADNCEYRVKPKPEELFITVQGDLESAIRAGCSRYANPDCLVDGIYSDFNQAYKWGKIAGKIVGRPAFRIFKVTEVTS